MAESFPWKFESTDGNNKVSCNEKVIKKYAVLVKKLETLRTEQKLELFCGESRPDIQRT